MNVAVEADIPTSVDDNNDKYNNLKTITYGIGIYTATCALTYGIVRLIWK